MSAQAPVARARAARSLDPLPPAARRVRPDLDALAPLDFHLPSDLEAHDPPEAEGRRRDDVRLLVSTGDDPPVHRRLTDLVDVLRAGDLLVVNTSATLPAAFDARRPGGETVVVHLSTPLVDGTWLVEVRRPVPPPAGHPDHVPGTAPLPVDLTGEVLRGVGGARVRVLAPWSGSPRLHVAALDLPSSRPSSRPPSQPTGPPPAARVHAWLAAHGRPVRYRPGRPWSVDEYQTVFARDPGSVEMPSAARPFSPEVVTALVAAGVGIAPITLHCGVSSLEDHEPPYPERFRVPAETAARVGLAHALGGRVIAVGTTAVRALESAADPDGTVHPAHGTTDLVITRARGTWATDGLITGWHEPRSSHLLLLEAVAGRPALEQAYASALAARYRWHEFGDLHLLLPGP